MTARLRITAEHHRILPRVHLVRLVDADTGEKSRWTVFVGASPLAAVARAVAVVARESADGGGDHA